MADKKTSDIWTTRGEIVDWIQVFGVIFAVLAAIVFASSSGVRIATALIVAATALILTLLRQAAAPHRWSPKRLALIGVQAVAVVALIVVAAVVNPAETPQNNTQPTMPATGPTAPANSQSAPHKVPEVEATSPTTQPDQSASGHVLRDSDFIDTNDQDKIDLDTACPGWGNQRPRMGPSRCGELADLILDPEGLHNANLRPSMLLLPTGTDANQQTCRTALANSREYIVSQIEADQLGSDVYLCVQTDLNAVAVVRIDTTNFDAIPAELTLSYELWKK